MWKGLYSACGRISRGTYIAVQEFEFEYIGVLRHMQQYFSHICDGTGNILQDVGYRKHIVGSPVRFPLPFSSPGGLFRPVYFGTQF